MTEAEAEQALDNLSSDLQEKYNLLQVDLEIQSVSNPGLPSLDEISASDWMFLLTGVTSKKAQQKYLKRIARKQSKETSKLTDSNCFNPSVKPLEETVSLCPFAYQADIKGALLKKWRTAQSMYLGNPIIFDMDFDMTVEEENKNILYLSLCYAAQKRHLLPFNMHVTGMKNLKLLQEASKPGGRLGSYFVNFHEESFTSMFPAKDLVYLSSDAPYTGEYRGDKVYIIGGSSSDARNNRLSYSKAKELGIPCVGLPLRRHFKSESDGRHDLNISIVYKILLDVNLHHNWRTALQDNLPPVQFRPLPESQKKSQTKHRSFKSTKNKQNRHEFTEKKNDT